MDAGTFHAFHTAWITHLSEALNGGLLPPSYYALPEQHGGRLIADVLTLQTPSSAGPPPVADGGVAVAETPPRVRRKLTPSPAARASRRTLTIRHVSGHRIVALGEIVSPANKDRAAHVAEFADKAETALWHGIHVLLVDLFPPGRHDPQGMHGAIWERFDDEPMFFRSMNHSRWPLTSLHRKRKPTWNIWRSGRRWPTCRCSWTETVTSACRWNRPIWPPFEVFPRFCARSSTEGNPSALALWLKATTRRDRSWASFRSTTCAGGPSVEHSTEGTIRATLLTATRVLESRPA